MKHVSLPLFPSDTPPPGPVLADVPAVQAKPIRRVGHRKSTVETLRQAARGQASLAKLGDGFSAPRQLPPTRQDCLEARGVDLTGHLLPCGFVSCRHHLLLDVSPVGGIMVNYPGTQAEFEDIDEVLRAMPATCSIDVAEESGEERTQEEVGHLLNMTRQAIHTIEHAARGKIEDSPESAPLEELVETRAATKQRPRLTLVAPCEHDADIDEDEPETPVGHVCEVLEEEDHDQS